jgi:hypothetical protein
MRLTGLKERDVRREDEEEDVKSYWMTSREKRIYRKLRERTRSYSLENSLWKRLGNCRKRDYVMMMMIMMIMMMIL